MRYMLLIYEDERLWEEFTGQEKDLDEALSIAAGHPGVRVGRHAIEVRPIRQRFEAGWMRGLARSGSLEGSRPCFPHWSRRH